VLTFQQGSGREVRHAPLTAVDRPRCCGPPRRDLRAAGRIPTGAHDHDRHDFDPVPVPGIAGATAVAADSGFTCAVHGAGAISCWGRNDFGQLGNTTNVGTDTPNTAPLPVIGFP
jgi:hypothetical protein